MSKFLAVAAAAVLALLVFEHGTVAGSQAVNSQAAVMKAFEDRVQQYVGLRRKLESSLPPLKPTGDPGEVEARQHALANDIRAARAGARQGDIFGPAAASFRQIVREDARHRSTRDVYATMQEVPTRTPPRVNADYPRPAPLATVPPLILTRLQRLPDGLEYRFLGRDLILRDTHANLIVDYVRGAVPAVGR